MKILIIKLAAIGDVLRTTSILPGLKEKYGAEIHWLVDESGYDIIKDHELIDKIFTDNNVKEEYDLLINLEDNEQGFNIIKNINHKEFIGAKQDSYTKSERFDMSLISKYGKKKADGLKAKNKKTYQKMIAEMLNIKEGKPKLNIKTNFGNEFKKKHNLKKPIIGLNTGAGKRWQLKKMSIEKTIELANGLKGNILLFGGKEEKQRNKLIEEQTKVIDTGTNNSLLEFASLINICDVLITSDSLAMNIAIALNKKTIVFFGPTSSNEIDIYNNGKKIIPKINCLSCYRKECDKNPNCMDLIDINKIIEEIK